jgi:hypothetical protein
MVANSVRQSRSTHDPRRAPETFRWPTMVFHVPGPESGGFGGVEAPGASQFCSRHAWGRRKVAYRSQFMAVHDRAWRDVALGASHGEVKQRRLGFTGIFEVGWAAFVPNSTGERRLISERRRRDFSGCRGVASWALCFFENETGRPGFRAGLKDWMDFRMWRA